MFYVDAADYNQKFWKWWWGLIGFEFLAISGVWFLRVSGLIDVGLGRISSVSIAVTGGLIYLTGQHYALKTARTLPEPDAFFVRKRNWLRFGALMGVVFLMTGMIALRLHPASGVGKLFIALFVLSLGLTVLFLSLGFKPQKKT